MIRLALSADAVNSKTKAKMSYAYYHRIISALAVIGLADSVYLAVSHYRNYTDIGYQSFCAVSRAINCDTVSQSAWSVLFGVPVPIWGILGYAAFLLCLLSVRKETRHRLTMWALLLLAAAGFTVTSISLALVSTYWVQSYCILCILSYVVNLFLLFGAWLVRNRFGENSFFHDLKTDMADLVAKPKPAISLLAFLAVSAAAVAAIPDYWKLEPPSLSSELRRGTTTEGHPWIGAEAPQVEIIEFSDYLCFQCRKLHYYLRQLVARYPDKIRLVHCHFPLDHEHNFIVKEPFHIGAGKMALIAIAAAQQDKFWEVNDLLFARTGTKYELNLRAVAESSGAEFDTLIKNFEGDAARNQLRLDLWKGLKLRITGTPSFVINGTVHQGNIPFEVFRKVIE